MNRCGIFVQSIQTARIIRVPRRCQILKDPDVGTATLGCFGRPCWPYSPASDRSSSASASPRAADDHANDHDGNDHQSQNAKHDDDDENAVWAVRSIGQIFSFTPEVKWLF